MKMNLKSTLALLTGIILIPINSWCQSTTEGENYLHKLPVNLIPDYSLDQKYIMTTDYVDYDLCGNFQRKKRITGECTLLKNGFVRWNNIKVAQSQNLTEAYPAGEMQNFMEDFTYNPASNILSDTFFNKIPQADAFMKNLVWDLSCIQTFAWYRWDLLKLNEELSAGEINSEITIPGVGSFENKDIRITWIGITKMNNEICAIFKYIAMNNPLQMDNSNVTIKGRSHYWGNIYVSLSDKQIEFADLYEDVIMDIKVAGQADSNYTNTVRKITLGKIR